MSAKDKKLGKNLRKLEDDLFFIVGCGRSGTTLLQSILMSGTEIAIPPETHFFRHVFKRQHEFGDLQKDENYKKILKHLFGISYIQDLELDQKVIVEKMKGMERSVRNLFLVILDSYREKVNKKRIGEKTPPNIHHLPEILRTFPKSKTINIVRDPRDVVNSLGKVDWSTPSVFGNVRRWKKCIKLHLKYSQTLPKSRYLSLRYEDLVKTPKEELKRVCNFLDMEYRDEMLEFYNRKDLGFTPNEYWKSNTLKPINTSIIGKGIRELRPNDIRAIEWMVSREMKTLGYERMFPRNMLGFFPAIWSAGEHLIFIVRTAFELLNKFGLRYLLKCRPGT